MAWRYAQHQEAARELLEMAGGLSPPFALQQVAAAIGNHSHKVAWALRVTEANLQQRMEAAHRQWLGHCKACRKAVRNQKSADYLLKDCHNRCP
jgi:hypothetical protein